MTNAKKTPRQCPFCRKPVPLVQMWRKGKSKGWRAPAHHKGCGRPGKVNVSQRRTFLKDRCERCGFIPFVSAQLQIDHRIPQSEGGSNTPENLQTLCANCHALKTYIESL